MSEPMTREKAIQVIEDYIFKCDYTFTVNEIVLDHIKKALGFYVSYTAEDCIEHCRDALDVMAILFLRAQKEKESEKHIVEATGSDAKYILDLLMQEHKRENPQPLTLKELKERVGKPVWTVTNGVVGSGRWEIVDFLYDCFTDSYGKTWIAYDHEPKEATNAD
jgi:hypothetical protein